MDVIDDKGNFIGECIIINIYFKVIKYKLGFVFFLVIGGLINIVLWKGVDFLFMFIYGFGGKIYDVYEENLLNDGNKIGY